MIFDFLKFIISHYKSIKTLSFLIKYISWILKLSPAIISMAGLFNIWYTNSYLYFGGVEVEIYKVQCYNIFKNIFE